MKITPRRSFELVGEFLWHWGTVEFRLNSIIKTVLELSPLQAAFVYRNTMFRDKIKIIRTAVSVSASLPGDRQKHFDKCLVSVSDYAPTRNMVAHDWFFANEEETAVAFNVIKAAGKFEIPNVEWTAEKFEEEYAKMTGFAHELDQLDTELKGTERPSLSMLAGLVSPTTGGGVLGNLEDLDRPPPIVPSSDPATPEESTKDRQEPED